MANLPKGKRRPQHGGARPGAGRPALANGAGRTAILKARATPGEKTAVAAYCARTGVSESELIRERLADVIKCQANGHVP